MNQPSSTEPTIQELFDLTDRVAMVTGGAGYLGTAICSALAEAGASVIVTSRDVKRAEEAAARLPRHTGAEHFGVCLDHKEDEAMQAGFAKAVDRAGRLDILFNNGQSGARNDWTDVSSDQFQDHLANATGYFLLARLARERAVQGKTPTSIIMLGSMYGMVASYPDAYEDICPASSVAYHALKGGIIHMTRHLAVYWAKDDVRVNCLSPGPFPAERAPREMVARLCKKSPRGRMGLPHELKGAALFLASDASSYMTGQNIVVDGGWTAW